MLALLDKWPRCTPGSLKAVSGSKRSDNDNDKLAELPHEDAAGGGDGEGAYVDISDFRYCHIIIMTMTL